MTEDHETFLVTVSEVVGADLHSANPDNPERYDSLSAVGRILDDDNTGKDVFTVAPQPGNESVAEGEDIVFWVNRRAGSDDRRRQWVTVEVAETGGDRVASGMEGTRNVDFKWDNRSPDSTVELRLPTAGAEAGAADSRVTVTVQQRSPYTVGEPSSATVTVTDMEKALPRLALLATEPSAFEGDTLEFTLTRTGPTGTALDVGLEVSETGAVVTDYPTAVRIERGQSAATFTVETRGDSESGTRSVVMVAMKKDAERYRFGNNSRAVSVTVKDTTDMQRAVVPEVTVSTGRASVSEGSPIEVTLTRTGGGEAVTVGLSVSETGNMLSAVVSQVPLAENASSATFSLLTLDDETDEKDSVVTVEIVPDAERYDVGEPSSVAVTVEDDDEAGARAAEPLTAAFEAVPESHDGDSAFTFELRFSEEPAAGGRYVARLRDHAFEVTGGRVREAERLAAPSNVRWRIEVEPDSRADVVVTLPGNRACDAPGAICADDERKLSNSPSLRVEGPAAEPLTAAFEAVPESHDGDSPFTFELRFSEEPAAGGRYVARLRDHAFEVTGGRVREAERLAAPSNVRWRIEVEPDSRADVVVTLPGNRACEGPGAICAEDGRRLSNSPSLRVEGPPAEPLTAAFEDMPAVHDGDDFTFGLTFSEEPAVSFRKLRDHAFEVGGGAVRTARRRQQGSNRGWTITTASRQAARPRSRADCSMCRPAAPRTAPRRSPAASLSRSSLPGAPASRGPARCPRSTRPASRPSTRWPSTASAGSGPSGQRAMTSSRLRTSRWTSRWSFPRTR